MIKYIGFYRGDETHRAKTKVMAENHRHANDETWQS